MKEMFGLFVPEIGTFAWQQSVATISFICQPLLQKPRVSWILRPFFPRNCSFINFSILSQFEILNLYGFVSSFSLIIVRIVLHEWRRYLTSQKAWLVRKRKQRASTVPYLQTNGLCASKHSILIAKPKQFPSISCQKYVSSQHTKSYGRQSPLPVLVASIVYFVVSFSIAEPLLL